MKQFKKTVKKNLSELLMERGVVTRQQLDMALKEGQDQGDLIGETLVRLKLATEKDIAQALTFQYGFPYLPLDNYEIDPEVVQSVPEALCVKYCLIPIDKIGKSLTLAMSNPLDTQSVEELERQTGCVVQVFLSTPTEIKQSIQKYYKVKE